LLHLQQKVEGVSGASKGARTWVGRSPGQFPIAITFGFNNIRNWGLFLAGSNAPFNLLGVSPAPLLIVVGVVVFSSFLVWTRKRETEGKVPLFAMEVIDSPKELSGDVGALRGTANNLAASVGTAVMGALVVGILSAGVMRQVTQNPVITAELKEQVNLDSINFLSNDRLKERLQATTASPEQVAEAVRINEESRLRALKLAFLAMAWSRSWPFYRPAACRTTGPARCPATARKRRPELPRGGIQCCRWRRFFVWPSLGNA
jgi:hypothetical protein